MKNKIQTSHTTHDQNGTPIYSVMKLCEITAENHTVKSRGKPVNAETIYATMNTMMFNEKSNLFVDGLAPTNLIRHDNNRLARNEGRSTIQAFCQALHLSHFECNVNDVYRSLNKVPTRNLYRGKKNFTHFPSSNLDKRTVTDGFNRESTESQSNSWTEGNTDTLPLDFGDPKPTFLKALILQDELLEIASSICAKIREATSKDTEQSICDEVMAEVFSFIQQNMEVK